MAVWLRTLIIYILPVEYVDKLFLIQCAPGHDVCLVVIIPANKHIRKTIGSSLQPIHYDNHLIATNLHMKLPVHKFKIEFV